MGKERLVSPSQSEHCCSVDLVRCSRGFCVDADYQILYGRPLLQMGALTLILRYVLVHYTINSGHDAGDGGDPLSVNSWILIFPGLCLQKGVCANSGGRPVLHTSVREGLEQHLVWQFSHLPLLEWPQLRTGPVPRSLYSCDGSEMMSRCSVWCDCCRSLSRACELQYAQTDGASS